MSATSFHQSRKVTERAAGAGMERGQAPAQHQFGNMTWIPDGRFQRGSARLPEERPMHRASLNAQHRALTGEIECPRACRRTPSSRWSTAPRCPREPTDRRQRVEDVAGRVPAWPPPGVVVQLLCALAELNFLASAGWDLRPCRRDLRPGGMRRWSSALRPGLMSAPNAAPGQAGRLMQLGACRGRSSSCRAGKGEANEDIRAGCPQVGRSHGSGRPQRAGPASADLKP
jgi:hypothetical protein